MVCQNGKDPRASGGGGLGKLIEKLKNINDASLQCENYKKCFQHPLQIFKLDGFSVHQDSLL